MRFEFLTTWWSQVGVLLKWKLAPNRQESEAVWQVGLDLEWCSIVSILCYWSMQPQGPPTQTQAVSTS